MRWGESFLQRLKNSLQAFEKICSAFVGVRLQSDEVLRESDAPVASVIREAPVNLTFPAHTRGAWPDDDRGNVLPFQVGIVRADQVLEPDDPIRITNGQPRREAHLRDHVCERGIR